MPVIDKPQSAEPLFGSGSQILIGGPLVHQLHQWKKRKATLSTAEGSDRRGSGSISD